MSYALYYTMEGKICHNRAFTHFLFTYIVLLPNTVNNTLLQQQLNSGKTQSFYKGKKMKYIGKIIKHYRQFHKMSMQELSENICSKDHIYLIESGRRTPSIKIVNLLANRLHFDWTEYIPYCKNPSPVKAKLFLDSLDIYINQCNTKAIIDSLNNVPDEPWAKSFPVDIEVLNHKIGLCIHGFSDSLIDFEADKNRFFEIIEEYRDLENFNDLEYTQLHTIEKYASLLIHMGKDQESYLWFNKLKVTLDLKKDIVQYKLLYDSILLQKIGNCISRGDYNSAILTGHILLKYERTNSLYYKIPRTLQLLSLNYKKVNKIHLANKCTKQARQINKFLNNTVLFEDIYKSS